MASELRGLFWNTRGQDRQGLIAQAAAEWNLDVVVIAEPGWDDGSMIRTLANVTGTAFIDPPAETPRIRLYARSAELDLEEVFGEGAGRLSIRRLRLGGHEFNFGAVHFESKLWWTDMDQLAASQRIADDIREFEDERGHRRTILVGDFNMNPFEPGMVNALGLHAMMTKADLRSGSRIVGAREYPFFYNPMWGLFGDRTPGPSGTLYYRKSAPVSYDWNMFDQLLIRPDALRRLDEDVEIRTTMGDLSLTTESGRPNRKAASDHLPLFFRLTQRN